MVRKLSQFTPRSKRNRHKGLVYYAWIFSLAVLGRHGDNGRPPFFPTVQALSEDQSNLGKDLILVMGLPRSGSLALHSFFECNGIASSHYCCPSSMTKGNDGTQPIKFPCPRQPDSTGTCGECVHANLNTSKPAFDGCGGLGVAVYSRFDVESDDDNDGLFGYFLPQHFTLGLLYKHYPHATWILNTRESSYRWATNVLHWFSETNRFLNSFGVPYHANIDPADVTIGPEKEELTNELLYQEIEVAIERANDAQEHERRKRALQDIYQQHTEKIRDFVQTKGSTIRLIEINVDDPDTGAQLQQAFFPDTKAAAACWSFDADKLDNDWKDFSLQL